MLCYFQFGVPKVGYFLHIDCGSGAINLCNIAPAHPQNQGSVHLKGRCDKNKLHSYLRVLWSSGSLILFSLEFYRTQVHLCEVT
jgi:hypothetical protein